MDKEKLELVEKILELEEKHKPVGDKIVDTTVNLVEAPFKIAGRLFDDIFG